MKVSYSWSQVSSSVAEDVALQDMTVEQLLMLVVGNQNPGNLSISSWKGITITFDNLPNDAVTIEIPDECICH